MSEPAIAASAYAAFLLLAAIGLDRLGRHAHDRSGRFRTQGFTYKPEVDLWECPEGEHLRPFAVDHHHRIVRYRAKPVVCNGCPAKDGCTDSDQGREIQRPVDPWPHSEAGRFHRGISVVLLGLASVVALAGVVMGPSFPGLIPAALMLAVSALVGLRMGRAFVAMPSGFPQEASSSSSRLRGAPVRRAEAP
jgi:hypothetical protein